MRKTAHSEAALFRFRGVPPLGMAVSMALQHLVSMIVGCVTPAIIIANTVGLPQSQRVLLIQASLVMSAVTTLLELFPIGGRFGAGLPVIFGVSFAYLPSMQAIASGSGGLAAVAGAMIVGGIVATLVGVFIKPIRRLFPPVITGTVVFTIGLSLYPTAIHYMAGGTGNTYASVVEERGLTEALVYGSWQNWAIAAFTLAVVLRAVMPSPAMSFMPVMAMVENTATVAPPSTHWGMVVRTAENLGTTPASSRKPPVMANTQRFTTLLVATMPTFWEYVAVGRPPSSAVRMLLTP